MISKTNYNKINPSQLNSFLMERLYDKNSKGIYNVCYRNSIDKFSQVIEEDFSDTIDENFLTLTNIYHSSDSSFNDEYHNCIVTKIDDNNEISSTITISQYIDSEKLPEYFAIFFKLGFDCDYSDKIKSNYKELSHLFDSSSKEFNDIINCMKYVNSNSTITFYNKYDKQSNPDSYTKKTINLGNFFNSTLNSGNEFYDGIITRKKLIAAGIPELETGNKLCAEIKMNINQNFAIIIPLIQVAYATPFNYSNT